MLVLGLQGSPLNDGTTARLLRAALDGARGEGATVEEVFLYSLNISPSDGCEKCVGECTIHDDNERLYELYPRLDALVVALPVYFENVPAHVKAVIDRCQALWMDKHLNKRRISPYKRPGAALLTAGSNDFLQFGYAWHVMRSWFTTVEVRMMRSQFIPGLDLPPARRSIPLFIEDARKIGAELVALAKEAK